MPCFNMREIGHSVLALVRAKGPYLDLWVHLLLLENEITCQVYAIVGSGKENTEDSRHS